MRNARQDLRLRTLKRGVITFADYHGTRDCVVRDVSPSGARLRFDDCSRVPKCFDLFVELDGKAIGCEVVRACDRDIGVRFVTGWVQVREPRRQSLQPTRQS
jgi:hypothetical protein